MLWCVNMIIAAVIGGIIEGAIKSVGTLYVGVEITFGYVLVSPFTGRVGIKDMKVDNPKTEPPFESPYLFNAQMVTVDMNMWDYLFTSKPIEMNTVVFDGVHLYYEKPHLTSGISNISQVKEHLGKVNEAISKGVTLDGMTDHLSLGIGAGVGVLKEEGHLVKDKVGEAGDMLSQQVPETSSQAEKAKDKKPRGVIIHKLSIAHDGLAIKVGSHTASADLPPLQSEDFSKECDSTSINGIMVKFVEKLAESAIVTAEKHAQEAVIGAVQDVKDAGRRMSSSIFGRFRRMSDA